MYRIILHEYGRPKRIDELAIICDTSEQRISSLFRIANSRIIKALSLKAIPFIIDSETIRVVNIAGTIRLSAQIELEIIPKYLGFSEEDLHWKEDFYLLSSISKHGSLFEGDNIHTISSFRNSLYDIAGRALAESFILLRRNLLRKYRRSKFEDYSVDGEIRFDDIFVSQSDGIPQERVIFDKKNDYNATILAAMHYVLPHTKDVRVQKILQQSIMILQPQNSVQFDMPRLMLPARDLRWKSQYDLAYDIIHGMGVLFSDGKILSPGFIISTWQIWEWLITMSIKMGESEFKVAGKRAFLYGGVQNEKSGLQNLFVYPDISVTQPDSDEVVYIVDAKYKLLIQKNFSDVNRADLYEAVAFCKSTRCNYIFLTYPKEYSIGDELRVTLATTYKIDGNTIFVIQVPVHGLALPRGLRNFSELITNGIKSILQNCIKTQVV